ncbi:MAG: metallophosphoesterase family protein [Anaerolineales bacterium]|nr:metallophosphoesterase family protein [Anaerolineales bacterium]
MANPHPARTFGLISDTHYLERLFGFPQRLEAVWAGVDLILHAGDVGDLAALDELGRIAPVAAVCGNDEPEQTRRTLPAQQLIAATGHRILLWHSHFPDRSEEIRRRSDAWGEKFHRIARRARDAGADIAVYGHTHVPMVCRFESVLLVNPGAIASGSYFTRQTVPSAGRLELAEGGESSAVLFDLRTGQARDFPAADPAEEFGKLGHRYQEWLVEGELIRDVEKLRKIDYRDFRNVFRGVKPEYKRAHTKSVFLRRTDLIAAFRSAEGLDPADREAVLAVLEGNADVSCRAD